MKSATAADRVTRTIRRQSNSRAIQMHFLTMLGPAKLNVIMALNALLVNEGQETGLP
jgi:hypothetical protein